MKSYFALNHNPDAKDLKQLSIKTGLSKRVLQVLVSILIIFKVIALSLTILSVPLFVTLCYFNKQRPQ